MLNYIELVNYDVTGTTLSNSSWREHKQWKYSVLNNGRIKTLIIRWCYFDEN